MGGVGGEFPRNDYTDPSVQLFTMAAHILLHVLQLTKDNLLTGPPSQTT